MKHKKLYLKKSILILTILSIIGFLRIPAQADAKKITFDKYHSPKEINNQLKELAGSHPAKTKLHKLAVSPGGNELLLLEIGPETGQTQKTLPSILVTANMEGIVPISSEAALYLAALLLDRPEVRKDKTWYLLPVGNPDAAWNYFKKPLIRDSRNAKPHNDDMDDQVDEDGCEDLDGNGIITMMRVKDPEGQWIPVNGESRLMKKADWTKGEKGIYKIYSEGIDNDHDGEINEDGPGGVNTGINFPHLFHFFSKSGGAWAGSEEETYNLFKFIYNHPEIAMTICLGETNFCKVPPRGGRKETGDYSKIKIPARIAERFGYDPDKTYTMKEIMEKARENAPPDFELTESMVAGFLGLGAAVNPLPEDLKFYEAISTEYKNFLKKNKIEDKRWEPAPAKDGSFELWSYYQLGLSSFSLDFWTLPKLEEKKKGPEITPEKLETMSKEDFLALGEEKIDAFLQASGAPGNVKAKMVMNMVKNGMMTTKKMAEMMRQMPPPKGKEGADPKEKALLNFSDKELGGKGFVNWKSFKHPEFGEVEIGGPVPFTANTPPQGKINSLIKPQVPWLLELVKKLPKIKIAETKVKSLGSGIYQVNVWLENTGFLPFPTAMGIRNRRIPPVTATLKPGDYKIISGKKREVVKSIKGNHIHMIQWMIHSDKPLTLTIDVRSPNAWTDKATLSLGGK